jgi:tetratricopeptide (TPR) repeat protein
MLPTFSTVRAFREQGILSMEFFADRFLGDCYWNLGDFEHALKFHEKYLRWSERSRSSLETQRALTTLAGTHLNMTALTEADEESEAQDPRIHASKAKDLLRKALDTIKILTNQDCPEAERTEMKLICYPMLSEAFYILGDKNKGKLNFVAFKFCDGF